MTTNPDQPVPVEQRLAEICARYGSGHAIIRAITAADPRIPMAADRILGRPTADRPTTAAQ